MHLLTWRLRCCCGCHCCGRCGCRLCDADALHKFCCFHLVNKNYPIIVISALPAKATVLAISIAISISTSIFLALPSLVTFAITVAICMPLASVTMPIAVSIAVYIVVFIAAMIIVISAISACIVSAVQRHRIGRIEIIVLHRCWLRFLRFCLLVSVSVSVIGYHEFGLLLVIAWFFQFYTPVIHFYLFICLFYLFFIFIFVVFVVHCWSCC